MIPPKVSVVMAARNEEREIASALVRLQVQTEPPVQAIVVDDGSTDSTREIAEGMGAEVVHLSGHEESWLGKPDLATVFNAGLARVRDEAEYVMILGADHLLPPDYLETITRFFHSFVPARIVSGRIEGEPWVHDWPRNSGSLVDAKWWRELNGLRYPVIYGYESWLVFKAREMGFSTFSLRSVVSTARPTRRSKGFSDGKAMYALGYRAWYALGRCAKTFPSSPGASVRMAAGFLLHNGTNRSDVAGYVRSNQSILERFGFTQEPSQ